MVASVPANDQGSRSLELARPVHGLTVVVVHRQAIRAPHPAAWIVRERLLPACTTRRRYRFVAAGAVRRGGGRGSR